MIVFEVEVGLDIVVVDGCEVEDWGGRIWDDVIGM